MFDKYIINHQIQRHIMKILLYAEYARFRDLRPKNIDTNVVSYHLKILQQNNIVIKTGKGYTLSQKGLTYLDRISADSGRSRTPPKIITMLLVQNEEGDVLVQKRNKQPYINTWTLPHGKVHAEDKTIESAAMREAEEKLGSLPTSIAHAGDCYIRVYIDGQLISTTFAHVFRASGFTIEENEDLQWVRPLDLKKRRLAPAVEQIVARSFFGDTHFFEEFVCTIEANSTTAQ